MCEQFTISEIGANVAIVSKTLFVPSSHQRFWWYHHILLLVQVWIKYSIWQDTPNGIDRWLHSNNFWLG